MMNFQNIIYNTSQFMVISLFLSFLLCFRRGFTTVLPVCVTSLPVSLSHTNNPSVTSPHGLTAQVNENLKQRRAPHMMLENSFYYSCTHTYPTLSYSEGRRRNSATCCNWYESEKFEAGGRNSLSAAEQLHISQTHHCLSHICISLKKECQLLNCEQREIKFMMSITVFLADRWLYLRD